MRNGYNQVLKNILLKICKTICGLVKYISAIKATALGGVKVRSPYKC